MPPTFAAPDGTRLAYDVRGSGAVLVCVPGGPMLDSAYLADLGGLDALRTLVRLDLRGTGASDVPGDPATYRCDRQVDDLEALREHLDLARMDILGHSAGANLVYRYAEAHPDRIGSLVLVTPSSRALGLPITHDMGAWESPAWVEEFRNSPEAAQGYAAEGAFDPPRTRAALARLDVPVLVMAAGEDLLMPPYLMAQVTAVFQRAELVVLAGVDHFPWADDPTAFVEALRPHL
jgi:pimeloyl-ACP methyl ester carboxylesterase